MHLLIWGTCTPLQGWRRSPSAGKQIDRINVVIIVETLEDNVLNYLLDELDAGGQIHPEVDELPVDPLLLVLLLLQHEHVVVEKLLQLLVGEVDAELLHAVVLKTNRKRSYLNKHIIHKEKCNPDFEHLTSKISKPAMSRTPMKCCLDCFVSSWWLIRTTIHRNIFS